MPSKSKSRVASKSRSRVANWMPGAHSKRGTLRRQNGQSNLFKNVNANVKGVAQRYYNLLEKVAGLQEKAQRGLPGAYKEEIKAAVKELNKAEADLGNAYTRTNRGNMTGGNPRRTRKARR